MTNNQEKTLTLIQQVYFDLCDLSNGSNYRALGYTNRKDWLNDQRERLLEAELRIKEEIRA